MMMETRSLTCYGGFIVELKKERNGNIVGLITNFTGFGSTRGEVKNKFHCNWGNWDKFNDECFHNLSYSNFTTNYKNVGIS